MRPFHVAVPVHDLVAARAFYGALLGCPEGRSAETWVDFNLFGHQFVCHVVAGDAAALPADKCSQVDHEQVPVPHYGVVLNWTAWEALAARLTAADVEFVIAPTVRFVGQPGEQATMFLRDPSGNALEFKALRNDDALFAT